MYLNLNKDALNLLSVNGLPLNNGHKHEPTAYHPHDIQGELWYVQKDGYYTLDNFIWGDFHFVPYEYDKYANLPSGYMVTEDVDSSANEASGQPSGLRRAGDEDRVHGHDFLVSFLRVRHQGDLWREPADQKQRELPHSLDVGAEHPQTERRELPPRAGTGQSPGQVTRWAARRIDGLLCLRNGQLRS